MAKWEEFFNYMANECGCAVTEDGAVHCCECGEPVYKEDFNGSCPCCEFVPEVAVEGSYAERVSAIADIWRFIFENEDMTDADFSVLRTQCIDSEVKFEDVLEAI